MSKVLVIGAGGVGSVAVHKMAMNSDVFSQITLASRRRAKCDAIAASVPLRPRKSPLSSYSPTSIKRAVWNCKISPPQSAAFAPPSICASVTEAKAP